MKSREFGFTLLELMITVAIVGILASIAYPSYRDSVARSARADAKAALLEDAQFMERNFTVANRYDKDGAGNDIDDDALPVKASPRDTSAAAKYNVTVEGASLTTSSFTVTATPVVGGAMDGDACGNLTLDQTGLKGVTGTKSVAECWNR